MNNKPAILYLFVALIAFAAGDQLNAAPLPFAYASLAPPLSGVWAAQETGAFKKYGLDVQLIYISSSTTNVQALLGGSLDVI